MLSPSTLRTDRLLEAYALQGGAWTLLAILADDAPLRPPPFDAIEFSLGSLWE